jgi:hypothetical protein
MRRKVAGRLFLLASGPSVPLHNVGTYQRESSHSSSATSRFHRGGLAGRTEGSTFSSALRLVSTFARA